MSANRDDGGPAFPEPKWTRCGEQEIGESKPGMTLRDWFAGQALAGAHADRGATTASFVAKWCWEQADAMMVERAKMERGQAPDSPAAGVGKGLPAMPAPASVCDAEDQGYACALWQGHGGDHYAHGPVQHRWSTSGEAPTHVPHCLNCGLILDSDRPYCLVCGCRSTCADGELNCLGKNGHDGRHRNGDVSWSEYAPGVA